MAEPVAPKLLAAIPARHDDHMIVQPLTLQHAQDHLTCPGLAVITLERGAVRQQHRPGVVRGAGEFLVALERLDEIVDLGPVARRPARDRVARPPVAQHRLELPHVKARPPPVARSPRAVRWVDGCPGTGCPDRGSAKRTPPRAADLSPSDARSPCPWHRPPARIPWRRCASPRPRRYRPPDRRPPGWPRSALLARRG